MNTTLLIFNLGAPEIVLIVLVVLLLFGGKKIPELMKGLGKGIKEFNSAKANIESEIKENMREIEEPKKEPILERKSNKD
ncbi:Sec-independent protein translocase subunit TatA/TatB [Portibacter lacus]|nr:twin-arginine translocase TatA/TatE family subunit [Portibacter lacus]